MNTIVTYFKNRLGEYSTWAGIMLVASSFGVQLTPEQQFAIAALGMALAGASEEKTAGFTRGLLSKGKSVGTDIPPPQVTEEVAKEVKHEIAKKSLKDLISDDRSL